MDKTFKPEFLVSERLNWKCVQVIVDYETLNDDLETVAKYFSLEDLEDEYFIELLAYFLSYGENKYQDWFDEFIYIPKDKNGKPLEIIDVTVLKFSYGQVESLVAYEED